MEYFLLKIQNSPLSAINNHANKLKMAKNDPLKEIEKNPIFMQLSFFWVAINLFYYIFHL
jgi:hypothetical protein